MHSSKPQNSKITSSQEIYKKDTQSKSKKIKNGGFPFLWVKKYLRWIRVFVKQTRNRFLQFSFLKNGQLKLIQSSLKKMYNKCTILTDSFQLQIRQVCAQYLVFKIGNFQNLLILLKVFYQVQQKKVKHFLEERKRRVKAQKLESNFGLRKGRLVENSHIGVI